MKLPVKYAIKLTTWMSVSYKRPQRRKSLFVFLEKTKNVHDNVDYNKRIGETDYEV